MFTRQLRRLAFRFIPPVLRMRPFASPKVPAKPPLSQSCDVNSGKCTPTSQVQEKAYAAMTEVENFIFEVKSLNDWTAKVMKSNVPVVLQFHADWCNPCRRLMPLLEKATMEGGGKWALAKVDIDEMKQLAQAVQVTAVPMVFLVHRGQVLQKMEGAPDEDGLKKFLDDVKLVAGLATEEDAVKGLHSAGEDFLAKGEWDNAIQSFEEILKHGKWKVKYELSCFVHLAKAYCGKKDLPAAERFAEKIRTGFPQDVGKNPEVKKALEEVKVQKEMQGQDVEHLRYTQEARGMETALVAAPTSTGYSQLAALHLKHGNSRAAIDSALKAIEIDQSFKGEGQTALLSVLKSLGPTHELVREARTRVQRLHMKFTV